MLKVCMLSPELDARHQMKKWGQDPAVEARHEAIKRDLALCERWFNLLP